MLYHLIVTLPLFLFLHFGLMGIFRKAGVAGWKAFIPVYNIKIWLELIGRPVWWLVWFLIPVLNFVMGIGLILNLLKSFGKHKFIDQALGVIFPFFYLIYLGWNKEDKYEGKWVTELAPHHVSKKGELREWLDAILFAGTAAVIIRSLLLEAFMIPTTSMEGSLKAGDFVVVSKFHYGVRMPMVPLCLPFVHNKMPLTNGTKSYLDWIYLPYSRTPAFKAVERNEIVVFNYPGDDIMPDNRELGPIKEISMKQNYIKRCVAVSGDTLQIKKGQIYINGEKGWNPPEMQFSYIVKAKPGISINEFGKLGFRIKSKNNGNINARVYNPSQQLFEVLMSDQKAEELRKSGIVYPESVNKSLQKPDTLNIIYPKDEATGNFYIRNGEPVAVPNPVYPVSIYREAGSLFPWNQDNYGPIVIPRKGMKVKLSPRNYFLYKRVIEGYEGHESAFRGGKAYVDGKVAEAYTFEDNYYFMMGDNRHGSSDSRFWGFVPHTHIIGRPLLVLFSWEGGPVWSRFFKPISRWEP